MPTGLSDTDVDSLRVQTDLLRNATPGRRAFMALALSADVMTLSFAGIRHRNPSVSNTDAGVAFVGIHYGPELAEAVRARLRKDAQP